MGFNNDAYVPGCSTPIKAFAFPVSHCTPLPWRSRTDSKAQTWDVRVLPRRQAEASWERTLWTTGEKVAAATRD